MATKRTDGRAELHVDTLCAVLLTHLVATAVELATVP
jgi:hypothetical protein